MASSYTPREQQYYNQLFDIVDKEQLGVLTGENSINFLLSSKLPQHILGEIWALADPNNTGYLTKDGWWKACRLIGWCQKGESVREELGSRAGPFPTFEGYPPPPTVSSAPGSNFMTPQTTGTPASGGSGAPALTPAEKTQYTRIFVGVPPEGGLVSGPKAQAIFLKSKLPYDKLAQIWNLADTQQRGSLDLPDFIIGMYYIQALMSGSIKDLPSTLPPGVYEAASGGRPRPPTAPASPTPRQTTGGTPAPGSVPHRQMTGGAMPGTILQPQGTGQSFNSSPARQFSAPPSTGFGTTFSPFGGSQQQNQESWDVSQQEKKTADGFFDGMDTTRRGYIEGDVAVPFMLQSGLDEDTLAQVWDLADIRNDGKLTREEFAVAMHLINGKLAGKSLPTTLPTSTIPPGLRSRVAAQSATSQPTRDLLDVFGDSPPATAAPPQQQSYFSSPPSQARSPPPMHPQGTGASTGSGPTQRGIPAAAMPAAASGFGVAPFAPAPPSRGVTARQPSQNLMGDDDETSRGIPDSSADVGNARNALDSTNKSLTSLQGEKESLEQTAKSSSAELHELEMRLSSVRAQHETETRLVNDLKTRIAEQKEKLKQSRDDLIRNESELSALRAEKDEIEQTLLQDKEEVRNIGKRMKEVTDETNTLKNLLEKMKKEARQQKGMVAISKKQVSTLESGKDAVQKEMDQVAASQHEDDMADLTSPMAERAISPAIHPAVAAAAAIPLPSTPQRAISPNATGVPQKSNNPFDRFNRQQQTSPLPPLQPSGSEVEEEHGSLSGSAKAMLGVGGAIAAAALAAGSNVVAGVVGAGTAAAATLGGSEEKESDEAEHEAEPERAAELSAETPAAGRDPMDPFRGPVVSGEKTPVPVTHVDDEDPFGMPSFNKAPEAPKPSEFESGFGDSFGDSFTSTSVPGTHTAVAPSNGPDFDDAFRDFEEPQAAPPATTEMPTIPHPPMPERTASTQAIPPTSEVHTPLSEMPSTQVSTPRVMVEEQPVPVDVKALEPHPEAEATTPVPPHQDAESSDEEQEEPEDLDGERSPFGASAREEAQEGISGSVPPLSKGNESIEPPSLQTLGLGPPLSSSQSGVPSLPEDRAATGTVRDDEMAPMPPAAPAAAIVPTSPVGTIHRRDPPPPPPPGSKSGSGIQSDSQLQSPVQPPSQSEVQSTNPFALFTSISAPTSTSTAQPQKQPSTTGFEDDDFDFENLPSATVASGGVPLPSGSTPHTLQQSKDFDSEFDDFSPDFEMVEPPSSNGVGAGNNQQSGVGGGSGFGILGGLGGLGHAGHGEQKGHSSTSGTSGFEDEDWGNLPTAVGQGQSHAQSTNASQPSTAGGFSFDDAFGGDFTPAPFTAGNTTESKTSQPAQTYAPPPGPPPGVRESYDHPPAKPELPSRGSMSRAQPDDLEDVKKLCGMGFDRSLVISALEANDYNLQKTLNVLLPGQ